MPTPSTCEREIEELHALFVRWYRGEAETAEFERVERALDGSFELISPDGSLSNRESVLSGVREAHGEQSGFDIEVRNVEPVCVTDGHALVRYEEWQSTPGAGADTGRLSTALFESVGGDQTPDGGPTRPAARWLYLQETWLRAPDS